MRRFGFSARFRGGREFVLFGHQDQGAMVKVTGRVREVFLVEDFREFKDGVGAIFIIGQGLVEHFLGFRGIAFRSKVRPGSGEGIGNGPVGGTGCAGQDDGHEHRNRE